jgi:MFS family permease
MDRQGLYDQSMQDILPTPEFKGREGLSRSLKSHLSGEYFYWAVMAAAVGVAALVAVDVLAPLLTGHLRHLWRWAALLEVLSFAALFCVAFILRETHKVQVQLHGDHFYFEDKRHAGRHIAFANIQAIRFERSRKLIPGFFIQLPSGEEFHIPLFLERVDYLLDALKFYRPELCTGKDFLRYRQYGLIMDHLAMHHRDRFTQSKLTYLAVVFSLPLLFRHELQRLRKDPNLVRRDMDYERRLEKNLRRFVASTAIVGLAFVTFRFYHHR